MRRLLSVALALAGALLAAAPASAQLNLTRPTCGASGGQVDVPAEPQVVSENFRTDGSGAVTGAQANAVLEAVRARLVGDFGWAAPPEHGDLNLYYARFGTPGQAGVQTTGTYTGTAGAGQITCLVLPNDADEAALRPFAARELAKAVWWGMGALSGPSAPAAWLREGAAELMEDEVFTDDAPDALPPLWDEALATYPDGSAATSWLALRGMTERFGTGAPDGVEAVVQDVFERVAAGTATNLAALGAALESRGIALDAAHHDYAIAAFFMKPCSGGYENGPCFADASGYGSPPSPHGSIPGLDAPFDGAVPAGLGQRFVALPAGPFDLTLSSTGGAGAVTGTVACDTGSGLELRRLGALGAGESARARNVDCADGVLVVSSDSGTGDPRGFRAVLSSPTAVLSILRYGEGLVASVDGAVSCGTACEAVYGLGSDAVLGAAPATGRVFTGWAGDCTGMDVCTVRMDRDRVVAAGFAPVPVPTAPVTPPGGGSPGGGKDTTAPQVLIGKPRFSKGNRKLRVGITCPAQEESSCTSLVDLKVRRGRSIRERLSGEALVGIEPGRTARAVYRLDSDLRAKLRRARRVKVVVITNTRDEAFNRLSKKRRVKVKTRR